MQEGTDEAPSNRAIETPHGTFWVQGLDRFAIGGALDTEVTEAVARHYARFGGAPKAVIWDDAVLNFRPHNLSLTLQRVFVPAGDPLLAAALDCSARAAVRADMVPADGLQTTDPLGGFAWPEEVAHAPGLMRMIGWPEQAPLREMAPPQPSGRAGSISIVINYRDKSATTIACLEHIRRQQVEGRLELLLVNNQSDDAERRAVKAAANDLFGGDPTVSVIHINYADTFNHSRQCNAAAAKATGEVLVMMSNDCFLAEPHALQTLADWALEPDTGVVGPRLVGDDGTVQCAGIAIGPRTPADPELRIHEAEVTYLSRIVRRAAGASFACAAIARTTWNELGGADIEAFTIDYNDAEFCLRLTETGRANLYVGTVSARHQAGMADVRTRESAEDLHARLAARHPLEGLPRLNPYGLPVKVYPDFASRSAQAICDYARTYRKALDLRGTDSPTPRLALDAAFDTLARAPSADEPQGQAVDGAARLVCATLLASVPDKTLPDRYRKSFPMLQAAFDEWRIAAMRRPVPLDVPRAPKETPEPDVAAEADPAPEPAAIQWTGTADPDPQREFLSHTDAGIDRAHHRILVFADSFGPSPQILFLEGLRGARAAGTAAVRILSEDDLLRLRSLRGEEHRAAYLAATIAHVRPTAIVYSRMADQTCHRAVAAAAAGSDAPRLCHIDDDFFTLPAVVGVDRYREGRHPRRIHTLTRIAEEADLVLASTPILARRMAAQFGPARVGLCEMSTGGLPFRQQPRTGPLTIGYFGSATHNRDLAMIAPALTQIRADHPDIGIEIVGSVARRSAAAELGNAVVRRPELEHDYAAFRGAMRAWHWDIGLAPLGAHPFNAAKTPIKWTEYAQAGIATLASRTEPYLDLGREGALMLASPDEWHGKLTALIADSGRRLALVETSNRLLASYRGWARMEERLFGLIDRAASRRALPARMAA